MKLSELFTDESKWAKGCLQGHREADGAVTPDWEFTKGTTPNCWCLLGGLEKMTWGSGSYHRAIGSARRAIAKLFPLRCGWPDNPSISAFNDHPDTTFADVQAVIKEAELNQ